MKHEWPLLDACDGRVAKRTDYGPCLRCKTVMPPRGPVDEECPGVIWDRYDEQTGALWIGDQHEQHMVLVRRNGQVEIAANAHRAHLVRALVVVAQRVASS